MNILSLMFYNSIRKTPPKFLIGFFFYLMFAFIIPKGKRIKNNYENYSFKEVEIRRGLILEAILKHK